MAAPDVVCDINEILHGRGIIVLQELVLRRQVIQNLQMKIVSNHKEFLISNHKEKIERRKKELREKWIQNC